MVLRELVTACRLAESPTRRSPVLVNATTEGVVRLPSEFSRTSGSPPSMTAMQEFVVPRSMPITFAIKSLKDDAINSKESEQWGCQEQTQFARHLCSTS